jgi:hypothetical protein
MPFEEYSSTFAGSWIACWRSTYPSRTYGSGTSDGCSTFRSGGEKGDLFVVTPNRVRERPSKHIEQWARTLSADLDSPVHITERHCRMCDTRRYPSAPQGGHLRAKHHPGRPSACIGASADRRPSIAAVAGRVRPLTLRRRISLDAQGALAAKASRTSDVSLERPSDERVGVPMPQAVFGLQVPHDGHVLLEATIRDDLLPLCD